MPDSFPSDELSTFMAEARRVLNVNFGGSAAWSELAGASNLIGWRYRASTEAWFNFRKSVEAHGIGRHHEDIYQQELSLFMMFSAGVSCIECCCYALAAATSHPKVCGLKFGTREQRDCSPKRLSEWLSSHHQASDMLRTLRQLLCSKEWELWVELRNRMTHRSNIPRRVFASLGAPLPKTKPLNFAPTSSTVDIDAELADWDALHHWLASTLRDLLASGTNLLRMS